MQNGIGRRAIWLLAVPLGASLWTDRTAGLAADALAWLLAVDASVAGLVAALRTPVLTKFMTSITGLGSASAAVVFLGLCYLAGWRRELRTGAVAVSLAGVVVVSLMALVQRPFPPQPVCVTSGTGLAAHSFPSGHAAVVTVYAGLARRSETLPFGPVAAVAAGVALSRVYLGTHYLSDTVAGVLVGAGALLVARRVTDHPGLARRIPGARRRAGEPSGES